MYTRDYHIKNVDDLYRLSPTQLKEQANILLYGHPRVLEEAAVREIFYCQIYIPVA